MRLADRMSRLGTESAFEVLARAKALEAQGRDIIHLEIGEPDFDTAPHIIEAAVKAMHDGETHYTPAPGIMPLRESIAKHIGETRSIDVSPPNVVVTPGAKPIMFFAILALLQAGDEAIYPNPGFPIYESMINFVGATPVALPLKEERGFSFDADEFRSLITDKTRLIIVNSPQNPTGGAFSEADLAVIAEVALAHDIVVLSDEIYDRMLYGGEHHSILRFDGMPERTILLNGFSKTYAMTGWRLGYGVMPIPLAEQMAKLMVNSNSCTAAFSQFAAVAALEGPQDEVDTMMAAFEARSKVIVDGLNDIPGFRCPQPGGAFYVFPNVEGTGKPSKELASYILQEAGVALLDGDCFGKYGEGYLRLSYANSIENITTALERIKVVVEKL